MNHHHGIFPRARVTALLTLMASIILLTASNCGGSGGRSTPPPSPPSNVQVTTENGEVTIRWESVPGATSYNLYFATEEGVTNTNYQSKAGGTKRENVTSPHTETDLDAGAIYYFVVTAVNPGGESGVSAETAELLLAWGPGDHWEFHATSSDGMDVRTAYSVLGTMSFKGHEVMVMARLLWDSDDTLSEATVDFLSRADLASIDLAGEKLEIDESILEEISVGVEGIETIAVPAGAFQAEKVTLSTADFAGSFWSVPQVARTIRSDVTQNGEHMTEVLTRSESVDPQRLEEDFLQTVRGMLEQSEPQARINGLQALALLGLYTKQSVIVDILNDALSDPAWQVQEAARVAMHLLETGEFETPASPSTIHEPRPTGTGHDVPAAAAAAPVIALGEISLIPLAFDLGRSALMDFMGDTNISIRWPDACQNSDSAHLPLELYVGDVIASFPLQVNFQLSHWRGWGIWSPFGMAGISMAMVPGAQIPAAGIWALGMALTTFEYNVEIVTDLAPPFSVGGLPYRSRSGMQMPAIVRMADVMWAHLWEDQPSADKSAKSSFKIVATLNAVLRGTNLGRPTWFPTHSPVECTVDIAVYNRFYVDHFEPSDKDHHHHETIGDHKLSFTVQHVTTPLTPPPSFVIQSLHQTGHWIIDWSLFCNDNVETPEDGNCRMHAPFDIDVAPIAQGQTGPHQGATSHNVEENYTLIGHDWHHHEDGLIDTNPHKEPLDLFMRFFLGGHAHGTVMVQGEQRAWRAENLLQGNNVNSSSLPIAATMWDRDPGQEENGGIPSHTLRVTKSGDGDGTVSSVPEGILCGADCESDYIDGTSVTLTALPASGSTFEGWSGDCSSTADDIHQASIAMTAAKTCDAQFSLAYLDDMVTVKVLVLHGQHWPSEQFFIMPPDACPADHYHSTGTVYSLEGSSMVDPDPGACGHGKVEEVEAKDHTVPREVWEAYLERSGG